MVNKIFIVLLLSCSFAFGQNLTDSKGKKQGSWSKTYPNSRILQYKGEFKDDKPVGKFTYYYLSNSVKAVIEHQANTNRSVAKMYHENGKLMSVGIYRNLKKDSLWYNYNEVGFLISGETFLNDQLNGKRVCFYKAWNEQTKSPRILSTESYVKGIINGEFTEYYESGAIKEKGTYTNGKKTGVWERCYASGRAFARERYKNGLLHGWSFGFDEAGKQIGKKYYYNGVLFQGKALEAKLAVLKQKGIDPNE
jgi:antitoxin component YwqK of YwqJK toxin-antitoxin module